MFVWRRKIVPLISDVETDVSFVDFRNVWLLAWLKKVQNYFVYST